MRFNSIIISSTAVDSFYVFLPTENHVIAIKKIHIGTKIFVNIKELMA